MIEQVSSLKDRLKYILNLRKMKQIDLANKTDIPKAAISQYISGYAVPKSDRIYKMAKALSVSEAWLMGFDVPMTIPQNIDYMIKNGETEITVEGCLYEESESNKLIRLFSRLNDTQKNTVLSLLESMVGE